MSHRLDPFEGILGLGRMADRPATPFDNIESAREYVGLLRDAVREAKEAVAEDLEAARHEGATRRVAALRIVTHKLEGLGRHLETSHHLLNDLRTLRRLLLGERGSEEARPPDESGPPED